MKLFIEGAGERRDLKSACREAFAELFDRAGVRVRPRVVACGTRANAFDRFRTEHLRGESAALLVDSEDPVKPGTTARQHLKQRDAWEIPHTVKDDQLHLFVQVMESWFLADPDACAKYFGQGFRTQVFPKIPIENASKGAVYQALESAVKDTKSGKYSKGRHSFDLLATLDPELVSKACPSAKRLLDWLRSLPA